jgi:hypothetical protein
MMQCYTFQLTRLIACFSVNENLQIRVAELEGELMRLSDVNASLQNENGTLQQQMHQLAAESQTAVSQILVSYALTITNYLVALEP